MRNGLGVMLALAVAVAGCGSNERSGPASGSGGGGTAGTAGEGGQLTGGGAGQAGQAGQAGLEWPNADHPRTSDPWIIEHHDELVTMRPRVLALNFVNARSNADMIALYEKIFAAVREGTRPHGYANENAAPFLQYEIAYSVDLTDDPPPVDWTYNNSTLYPREEPPTGTWGFDYQQLFTAAFADLYGIADPATGKKLTLCELSERGLVHEVWIYADADVPDAGAAEVLGIQPKYDESFVRIQSYPPNPCAGNGCFDADDVIPADCTRTLRIGFVNNTRGVGCYLESLSHGMEWIGNSNDVPYLTEHFREFAGFDLGARYGLPFQSWYACTDPGCLSYPTTSSVAWKAEGQSGVIDPYVPACGNAHFPPNGRQHYDIVNTEPVLSTCRAHRQNGGPGGGDPSELVSAADWKPYESLASDCDGPFLVWWWQNFPGVDRKAKDVSGKPMKNWWPFFFY